MVPDKTIVKMANPRKASKAEARFWLMTVMALFSYMQILIRKVAQFAPSTRLFIHFAGNTLDSMLSKSLEAFSINQKDVKIS